MLQLGQSAAVSIGFGPIVDSVDGSPETGQTIVQADVRLKKNGGDWAQKNESSNSAHEENGMYEVALDATDTNTAGILIVKIAKAGTLVATQSYMVGNVNAQVKDMDADVLTAAALAADAVTEIQSGLATASVLATVATYVDTEIATLQATVDAIKAALVIREGTARLGGLGATNIKFDAGASAIDDFYNDQIVVIVSGTGAGQARLIEDYIGSSTIATVAAWKTNPDDTSVFKVLSQRIVAAMGATPSIIADAVADEMQAGHDTVGSLGWMIRQLHSRHAGYAILETTTKDMDFRKIDGVTKDFGLARQTIDATHVALVPEQGP